MTWQKWDWLKDWLTCQKHYTPHNLWGIITAHSQNKGHITKTATKNVTDNLPGIFGLLTIRYTTEPDRF